MYWNGPGFGDVQTRIGISVHTFGCVTMCKSPVVSELPFKTKRSQIMCILEEKLVKTINSAHISLVLKSTLNKWYNYMLPFITKGKINLLFSSFKFTEPWK